MDPSRGKQPTDRRRPLLPRAGWAWAVAAIAVVTLALAAPASAGQTLTFSSTPTISERAPYFHGTVVSGTVCEKKRRVKLFKVRPGADKLLGRGRTNWRGTWTIRAKRKRGSYYVRVKRAQRQRGSTTYVCRKGRSSTISLR